MAKRTVRTAALLPGVRLVIERLRQEANPERVILFGSRARGPVPSGTDWDLCVVGVQNQEGFRRLLFDMIYDPPVLLPIDLVEYEAVDPDMRAAIDRDGVEIRE
jgi:predicted nucleotidyltransferase